MLRKRQKSPAHKLALEPTDAGGRKKLATVALLVVPPTTVPLTACFALLSDDEPAVTSKRSTASSRPVPKVQRTAEKLDELLKLTPERLGGVGIAAPKGSERHGHLVLH